MLFYTVETGPTDHPAEMKRLIWGFYDEDFPANFTHVHGTTDSIRTGSLVQALDFVLVWWSLEGAGRNLIEFTRQHAGWDCDARSLAGSGRQKGVSIQCFSFSVANFGDDF